MYQGSICQVRATTTQISVVSVWPSHVCPSPPQASMRALRMPYWPLKIHVHRKPMAVPGIIQLTSVTPRRNSLPRKPWLSTIAQIRPRRNGRAVESSTNAAVVSTVCPK